jgi:hypothetical protein
MRALWQRIGSKKALLDVLRPLAAKGLAALNAWYGVELTYTSNAIEGNTLTRSETAIVLEKGITIGGKPLKDHLEVLGHKDALNYVRAITALIVIRDKAIKPLLAAAQDISPTRGAQNQRVIDRHYLNLRTAMKGVFHELGIAA